MLHVIEKITVVSPNEPLPNKILLFEFRSRITSLVIKLLVSIDHNVSVLSWL